MHLGFRSPWQPYHLRQNAFQLERREHRIAVMQTAALICKLLSLLAVVKDQTSSSVSAIRTLWEVLQGTATFLLSSQARSAATAAMRGFSSIIVGNRCLPSAWNEPEISVSQVLVSLTMAEMRGQLKQSNQQVKTCCMVIESLLPVIVDDIEKIGHGWDSHSTVAIAVGGKVYSSGQLPTLVCPEPVDVASPGSELLRAVLMHLQLSQALDLNVLL